MLSAVVSFHTNPYTCGVARFNRSLAQAMNVNIVSLDTYLNEPLDECVLLSLKLEEISADTLRRLDNLASTHQGNFALLLHGSDGSDLEASLCVRATQVFAASAEIARTVSKQRSDVISVFAPGASVLQRHVEVDCTLLTFGMAHKIRSDGYRRLAGVMQGDKRAFRLEISTALHEGGTFDESFFTVGEEISHAFGGNVRFLGFLADAEVSERLREVDALVAFFPRGVRENNTTVLSAMSHGCAVITNLDADSPPWMVHDRTVFDVNQLTSFPDATSLRRVGDAAAVAAGSYNFERLANILQSS